MRRNMMTYEQSVALVLLAPLALWALLAVFGACEGSHDGDLCTPEQKASGAFDCGSDDDLSDFGGD